MPSIDLSSKQNWEGANRFLYLAFKKEIEIMRELLANLHEEELSLLEQNLTSWHQVIGDRSDLVVQLMDQRKTRIEATKALESVAKKLSKELLPPQEETSCEILSQIDQLIALIDRTNLQNCRNEILFKEAKGKKEVPLYCSYPHPLHKPKAKRKLSTATYPRKK